MAGWIADGSKTLEIRSRRVKLRTKLLICAAKKSRPGTSKDAPRGVALCVVELVDCREFTPADQVKARVEYRPGRFAWVLTTPKAVKQIPVKGQQGLFHVEDSLIEF
jgi:hypothetical protein